MQPRFSNAIVFLCAVALLAGIQPAHALVTNAAFDLNADPSTLTLKGFGFGDIQGNGNPIIVIHGGINTLVALSWSDTEVVADLSSVGQLDAGTYLCVVRPDSGPPQTMSATLVVPAGTEIDELPFVIDSSGFFFLRRDLTGVSGESGITVGADNVTIDLNGFSLIGVEGSSDGIEANSRIGVAVRNGVVRQWGGIGIDNKNGSNGQFSDLRLYENGDLGIHGGDGALIRDTSAECNARSGLACSGGCVIRDSSAQRNGDYGINVTGEGLIRGNNVFGNATGGLFVGNSSVVENYVQAGSGSGC